MAKYQIEATVLIEVDVNDDAVIRRCVENWNDDNQPVPYGQGQRGWRDIFYTLADENDVIEHLAFNLGIRDCYLRQLDGWADMDNDAADARIVDISWWKPIRIDNDDSGGQRRGEAV